MVLIKNCTVKITDIALLVFCCYDEVTHISKDLTAASANIWNDLIGGVPKDTK